MIETDPRDLVDLTAYPIEPAGGPQAQALIAEGRAELARSGLCLLPGFLKTEALAAMVAEAQAAASGAWRRDVWYGLHDGYRGAAPSPHGPSSRNAMAAIACDRLDPDGPLRRLYQWDGLTAFIGALVGCRLHRCADPLAALSVTLIGDGDEHGWHYDENDFVVSLLLQDADVGGRFEVWPGSRDMPDAAALEARLIAGDHVGLLRPAVTPGTLSLFRGQRSLHRVSPASGARPRCIALFSYDRRAGMAFSDSVRLGVFGRVA